MQRLYRNDTTEGFVHDLSTITPITASNFLVSGFSLPELHRKVCSPSPLPTEHATEQVTETSEEQPKVNNLENHMTPVPPKVSQSLTSAKTNTLTPPSPASTLTAFTPITGTERDSDMQLSSFVIPSADEIRKRQFAYEEQILERGFEDIIGNTCERLRNEIQQIDARTLVVTLPDFFLRQHRLGRLLFAKLIAFFTKRQ